MINTNIQQNYDLRLLNTFGIPVKAHFYTPVSHSEDLRNILQNPQWEKVSKLILGGGSNILFTQDFAGLVIKNEIKGIEHLDENDDHVWLKIGAGECWHELVLYCIEKGYGGIENLSLIPGTVGAAPIQNIGAYGAELSNVFQTLEAVNITSGEIQLFNHAQCEFGYRDSIFKARFKNQFAITHVTLQLQKKPIFNVSYGAVQDTLKAMNITELSLKAISDAVIQIRRSKLPDPKLIGNAGSFFKNPIIPTSQIQQLQKDFANIPCFSGESAETIKISAGWLIEQCGWKGKRLGDIGVHDKQALVIVNYGAGTGADIQDLVRQIQGSVYDRFGVQLTPEVNIM